MRTHDLLPTAFVSIVLLGSLTGCPAKSPCPPCYVGGVMDQGGVANQDPKSALYVQLGDSTAGTVSELRVTITADDGSSEEHKYSGDAVAGVNAATMTEIADKELYDIDGKAPSKATIEIVYDSGSMDSDSIGVQAETSGGTAVEPAPTRPTRPPR